jgi:hypothetical protein
MSRAQTLYKLTRADMTTRGGYAWPLGKTQRLREPINGRGLCSSAWLHAYLTPELAEFLDPIHGNFGPTGRLFEARGVVRLADGPLKVGVRALALTRELTRTIPTIEQRVSFGILCAWSSAGLDWRRWAARWLRGEDRTEVAAWAAAAAAAAWAARAAATEAAAWAARAARAAATEAAWAAAAAAARAATEAAWAAEAAEAAEAATHDRPIDECARLAMRLTAAEIADLLEAES